LTQNNRLGRWACPRSCRCLKPLQANERGQAHLPNLLFCVHNKQGFGQSSEVIPFSRYDTFVQKSRRAVDQRYQIPSSHSTASSNPLLEPLLAGATQFQFGPIVKNDRMLIEMRM